MNTRKLEESTRLVDSLSWSAIATGTIVALAVQTVLALLGLGFATSVGDGRPGGVYDVWIVIVDLVSIAIGAALTARLSHAERRMNGVAAGMMTWAVVVVLGNLFQGVAMMRTTIAGGAWAAFFGAIIGLVAAALGGAFGARLNIASADHETLTTP